MTLKIDILSIFPGYFESSLKQSIIGRAIDEGRCEISIIDFRNFSSDKHQKVDGKPCGGGPGMVLALQPVVDCLRERISNAMGEGRKPRLIITTCRGKPVTQEIVSDWSADHAGGVIILCGHYEDFDARLYELFEFEEISLGDFVLSGGEPAALCIVDVLVRTLPGVVGNPESITEESFSKGLLDYPSYTKPVEFEGLKVPDVLLGGNHALIEKWRKDKAEELTRMKRPDLLDREVE